MEGRGEGASRARNQNTRRERRECSKGARDLKVEAHEALARGAPRRRRENSKYKYVPESSDFLPNQTTAAKMSDITMGNTIPFIVWVSVAPVSVPDMFFLRVF